MDCRAPFGDCLMDPIMLAIVSDLVLTSQDIMKDNIGVLYINLLTSCGTHFGIQALTTCLVCEAIIKRLASTRTQLPTSNQTLGIHLCPLLAPTLHLCFTFLYKACVV